MPSSSVQQSRYDGSNKLRRAPQFFVTRATVRIFSLIVIPYVPRRYAPGALSTTSRSATDTQSPKTSTESRLDLTEMRKPICRPENYSTGPPKIGNSANKLTPYTGVATSGCTNVVRRV